MTTKKPIQYIRIEDAMHKRLNLACARFNMTEREIVMMGLDMALQKLCNDEM